MVRLAQMVEASFSTWQNWRKHRGSSEDYDITFLRYILHFDARWQTRRQQALGLQEVFESTTAQPCGGSDSERTVAAHFSHWATNQYRKALQASKKFHVVTTENCTDGRDRWIRRRCRSC